MGNFEEVGVRAVVAGASAYVAQARQINAATGDIGDTAAKTETKVEALDVRLRKIGTSMEEAGRRAVTMGAALGSIAVGSTIAAGRFEASLTKVVNLSGIAREEIGSLREGILRISRETAQGPQELADALLVITSTGLRGAEALNVLELAAKGSAIGLGDTAEVGRTITAVLKAYEKQGISAARATDILLKTAREGGADVDQLAGALGRVVGVAATFGVSLEEVGAFIATFTRLGISADEAVTALRGTILAIFGPAEQSKKALEELGTTSEKLRAIVQERGLAAALEEIVRLSRGDSEAISDLIPNVRALAGVLGTVGTQGQQYREVLAKIKDDQDALNEAFGVVAETPMFRFQQALADVKAAAIELGANGLPILAALANAVSLAARAFAELPEPVQQAILVVSAFGGGALVLVGTVGLLAGAVVNLVAAWTLLGPVIASATAVLLANPLVLAGVAAAAIGAGVAYVFFKNKIDDLTEAQRREAEAARLAAEHTREENLQTLRSLAADREAAVVKLNSAEATGTLTSGHQKHTKAMQDAEDEIERLDSLIKVYSGAVNDADHNQKIAEKSAREMAQGIAAGGDAAGDASGNLVALSDKAAALKKEMDSLSASSLATKIILESIANIQGATFENVLELIDPGALQRQIEAAGAKLKPILDVQDAIQATLGRVTNAAGRLTPEQQSAAKSAASDAEKAAKEAERAAEEEARRINGLIGDAAKAAQQLTLDQIKALDTLGDQVVRALRARAEAEKDAAEERIATAKKAADKEAEATIAASERARDAAVAAIEYRRDANIRAIEDERDARLAAIDAEIRALDQQEAAEDRLRLVREIALSFDPNDRADAERALRDFDRKAQQDRLRDQAAAVKDAADAEIEGVKANATSAIEAAKQRSEQEIAIAKATQTIKEGALDAELRAAQASYKAATEASKLESEARKLVISGELGTIAKLLDEFVPEWRTAGQSFGEQLVQGIKASGVEQYIANLLASASRLTGGAVGGKAAATAAAAVASARDAEIAGRQDQLRALVQGGAPQTAIDQLREALVAMGVVPQFAGGLDVGMVRRPILAALDPGEVVLNRDQQAAAGGNHFAERAFAGMFDGATFAGTPEENGRAIERAFRGLFADQLGRDAHLWGAV